jgi:hypothetical protein
MNDMKLTTSFPESLQTDATETTVAVTREDSTKFPSAVSTEASALKTVEINEVINEGNGEMEDIFISKNDEFLDDDIETQEIKTTQITFSDDLFDDEGEVFFEKLVTELLTTTSPRSTTTYSFDPITLLDSENDPSSSITETREGSADKSLTEVPGVYGSGYSTGDLSDEGSGLDLVVSFS